MMKIGIEDATEFTVLLLQAMGVSGPVARDVAGHLVESDRAGYPSHGLSILPGYRQALVRGEIAPQAELQCLRDEGVVLAFDGRHGFGQHVGKAAMARAIERARECGLCVFTLRHAHHLGRIGYYGEQAAAAGLALLAFTNIIDRAPMVAPFGGAQARLTTNPLCFVWPLPGGRPPFVLDLATSAIALNKARVLAARGEPAPEGALVDAWGKPTTDASVMVKPPAGALLPFGGHKGYGLGLAVELFAGILSGGGMIGEEDRDSPGLATNNMFALLLDPAHFADPQWTQAQIGNFIDYLHGCPPTAGGEGVQYPGEYEARNRERHAVAIELDGPSWEGLRQMAAELGVAVPPVAG